jgi:hypothetical protein
LKVALHSGFCARNALVRKDLNAMTAKHGTANRYNQGCRCDACKDSRRLRAADYRQRRIGGEVQSVADMPQGVARDRPGPVESAVQSELEGLTADRSGLVETTLALARIMDNPRAVSSQPAADKVLAALLDELHTGSAHGRHGKLTVVRTMT